MSGSVLEEAKEAMVEYYSLLCRMPHMELNCLRMPPVEGWPDSHARDLRAEGWSDEAADFVRHLPYVAPVVDAQHVWIVSSANSL